MNNSKYQLAQINIAKMNGKNIDDPIMKEFVDNLDHINGLAEMSEGFIWRLKDDTNNATEINPYNDEQIIVNLSVWKDLESLKNFMYNSHHSYFLKHRKKWFTNFGKPSTALWWIKSGNFPTIEEATLKLKHLQDKGVSLDAFNLTHNFAQPLSK